MYFEYLFILVLLIFYCLKWVIWLGLKFWGRDVYFNYNDVMVRVRMCFIFLGSVKLGGVINCNDYIFGKLWYFLEVVWEL